MSQTISHVAFIKSRPVVSLTTAGRVKLRFGDDVVVTLDLADARSLVVDIEGAVIRHTLRGDFSQSEESPLAS